MKRLLSVCMCLLLFTAVLQPVSAAAATEEGTTICQEYTLDNGLTVIEEITEIVMPRSTVKQGTKKTTLKDGDTVIAVIAFTAQFGYDGTSAWVVSKTVTQTDTYESWTYKQDAFSSNGSTVTLSFTLSRGLFWNSS